MTANPNPTPEAFVDWTLLPATTPDGRIATAGAFWERGEPLTDEVWATREYLRRKFGRDDIAPPRAGWYLNKGGTDD